MGHKWGIYTLESICEGIFDCPHSTPKLSASGPYMVRTQDIRKGYFDTSDAVHVSEDVYQNRIKRVEPSYGDLVFSREGTYFGDAAEVPQDTKLCLGQRMVLIRPNPNIIRPSYLRIYINSSAFQAMLKQYRDGTVAERLNLPVIRKLPIAVPPLTAQKAIEDKTCCLEQKVELNRRTNQTLEAIAQTLFKSWFVDFDPVKAKLSVLTAGGSAEEAERAAMCAISARDEASLNTLQTEQPEAYAELARTAALFPSAMQDSELGEIPVGWKIKPLSELINITGGGTPKRSEPKYWNGDIPWFSVKDVPAAGNVFVIDTDEKITEEGLKKSSTKLLKKGTTIITARGTVGKLALLAEDMCMNQSCYGVNGKETGPYFNYFNLLESIDTLRRNTHGAVFDTITTKTFETHLACFPRIDLATIFDLSVSPMLQQIEINLREIGVLKNLRDTLLPKLLSGKLTLPDTTPPKANPPESDMLNAGSVPAEVMV